MGLQGKAKELVELLLEYHPPERFTYEAQAALKELTSDGDIIKACSEDIVNYINKILLLDIPEVEKETEASQTKENFFLVDTVPETITEPETVPIAEENTEPDTDTNTEGETEPFTEPVPHKAQVITSITGIIQEAYIEARLKGEKNEKVTFNIYPKFNEIINERTKQIGKEMKCKLNKSYYLSVLVELDHKYNLIEKYLDKEEKKEKDG